MQSEAGHKARKGLVPAERQPAIQAGWLKPLMSAHSGCLKSASLGIASLNIIGYLANGTRATIRGSGRTETGAMAPFGIDIADLSADGRKDTGGGTGWSSTV